MAAAAAATRKSQPNAGHAQSFTGMHKSDCLLHLQTVLSKYVTTDARIARLTKLWLFILVILFKQRTMFWSHVQWL
jgi:hypothetical protein